jgi:hypothetical protein
MLRDACSACDLAAHALACAPILNICSSRTYDRGSPAGIAATAAHAQPPRRSGVDSRGRRRSRYHVAIEHAQRRGSHPRSRHGNNLSDRKAAGCAAGRTSSACAPPIACATCGAGSSRGRPAHCGAAGGTATATGGGVPGYVRAASRAATPSRRAAPAARASLRRVHTGSRRTAGTQGASGRRSRPRKKSGCRSGTTTPT